MGRNCRVLVPGSPPPGRLGEGGKPTPDLWPGPRPEERLASSCSTSSSCRESLNRINLLVIGDHCSLCARSSSCLSGPGREGSGIAGRRAGGAGPGGGALRNPRPGGAIQRHPLGTSGGRGKLCLAAAPVPLPEAGGALRSSGWAGIAWKKPEPPSPRLVPKPTA